MAPLSFAKQKICCGEGGALPINQPRYVERAEIQQEKGTNRARFFRGMVDKYTWVDVRSSYLPSVILPALHWVQLEQFENIQTCQKTIWQTYQINLAPWAVNKGTILPTVPAHCFPAYHLFTW